MCTVVRIWGSCWSVWNKGGWTVHQSCLHYLLHLGIWFPEQTAQTPSSSSANVSNLHSSCTFLRSSWLHNLNPSLHHKYSNLKMTMGKRKYISLRKIGFYTINCGNNLQQFHTVSLEEKNCMFHAAPACFLKSKQCNKLLLFYVFLWSVKITTKFKERVKMFFLLFLLLVENSACFIHIGHFHKMYVVCPLVGLNILKCG